MSVERIQIDHGPDLMRMIMSLSEGNPTPRKTVQFETRGQSRDLKVAVTGMDQADGSGNCWTFHGYGSCVYSQGQVHGYYDTQVRKGWFAWGAKDPH